MQVHPFPDPVRFRDERESRSLFLPEEPDDSSTWRVKSFGRDEEIGLNGNNGKRAVITVLDHTHSHDILK